MLVVGQGALAPLLPCLSQSFGGAPRSFVQHAPRLFLREKHPRYYSLLLRSLRCASLGVWTAEYVEGRTRPKLLGAATGRC